jgi:hypothetical protein
MIACEASAIHGLWFKEAMHDYVLKRYFLPFLIALPALFLFVYRLRARQWVAQGQITSNLAIQIFYIFGLVTIFSYMCILDLAELAFSPR